MRDTGGQGTIEYVAVLALVAVVLAAGTAAASGIDVGRRVTREWARALCLVARGDCRRDQEPCVVATDGRRRGAHVNLFVVRLGGDTTVVLEERSDGSVAVTRASRDLLGVEGGVGADASVDAGPVDVGLGAEVRAALLARLGEGRTWIVPSRAATQTLLAAIGDHAQWRRRDRLARDEPDPPPLPSPDVTYEEKELDGSLTAALTGTALVDLAGAEAGGGATRRAGVREDHRTGRRTVYLSARAEATASAHAGGGVLGVTRAAGHGGERYAVELDHDGTPVALSIVAAGAYGGSADLPAVVSPVVGRLAVRGGAGRAYEVTAQLDLTQPANLAAARDLIGQLLRPAAVPRRLAAASAALRERLAAAGTVEARVLAQARDGTGFDAHGALGGKLGAGWARETWSAQLLAAASRGLDGQWLTREDCG